MKKSKWQLSLNESLLKIRPGIKCLKLHWELKKEFCEARKKELRRL